jgi:hypothetical protein
MNVADELNAGINASVIWEGICSDDYVLVHSKMRTLSERELIHAYGVVASELFNRKKTPGLDIVGKKVLSDIADRLSTIFADAYAFKRKLSELNEMPDGYPKYQSLMVFFGKDPLTYHEWVEAKETVDASLLVR